MTRLRVVRLKSVLMSSGLTALMISAAHAQSRTGAEASLLNICDTFAASPYDMARPEGVAGIEATDMNAELVLMVCGQALDLAAGSPDEARIVFQLGRGQHVGQDYDAAMTSYVRAADLGYALAMNNIGLLHFNGEGRPVDHVKAREWFARAAGYGVALSLHNLGLGSYYGQGTAQNHREAFGLFYQAATRGHAQAQYMTGVQHLNGEGVTQDHAAALRYFRLAAAQDEPYAHSMLGNLHVAGEIVPRDLPTAARHYETALAGGLSDAGLYLAELYLDGGPGLPRDPARARVIVAGLPDSDQARDLLARIDGRATAPDNPQATNLRSSYTARDAALVARLGEIEDEFARIAIRNPIYFAAALFSAGGAAMAFANEHATTNEVIGGAVVGFGAAVYCVEHWNNGCGDVVADVTMLGVEIGRINTERQDIARQLAALR